MRLLSLLQLPLAVAQPVAAHHRRSESARPVLNPLATIAPKPLLWGEVGNWTGSQVDPVGRRRSAIRKADDHVGRLADTTDDRTIMWGDVDDDGRPDPRNAGRCHACGRPSHQHALPRRWLPAVVGVGVVAGAAIVGGRRCRDAAAARLRVALFAVLALAGSFPLKSASVSATISVDDTFFIASALLFGTAPGDAGHRGQRVRRSRAGSGKPGQRRCSIPPRRAFSMWVARAGLPSASPASSRSRWPPAPIAPLVPPLALTAVCSSAEFRG